MIVAIDPGVRCADVALFEDRELTVAWLVYGDSWFSTANALVHSVRERIPLQLHIVTTVVVERMQVYHQSKLDGDPNDLVSVAMMAGAACALLGVSVIEVLPRQWKGQVPKKVHNDRVWNKLSDEERQRVELPNAQKERTNVIDAIGIGRWYLEREW